MKLPQERLTFTGQYVHLTDARPETINIIDIAHQLAQTSRLGGASRLFYSYAQHSVGLSQLVPKEYQLHALLESAPKAYLGTLVHEAEFLPNMAAYRDHEASLRAAIYHRFGLGMAQDDACRDAIFNAAQVMRSTERRDLLPPDAKPWLGLENVRPRTSRISPLLPSQAEQLFLYRYKELSGEL